MTHVTSIGHTPSPNERQAGKMPTSALWFHAFRVSEPHHGEKRPPGVEGAPQHTPPQTPLGITPLTSASRVLYIALTAGDQVDIQVDMGVANRLSGGSPLFIPMLKPLTRRILFHISARSLVQQLIYGAPLRLEQVEESCGMPFGYHKRMQFRHRVVVADATARAFEATMRSAGNFAEDTARLP